MEFSMMSILRRNLKDVAKTTADPTIKKALATMADQVKTLYARRRHTWIPSTTASTR
jgi:hypothetical protein